MTVVIIVAIIIILCIVVFSLRNKDTKSLGTTSSAPTRVHCSKCGSDNFRFLWDKRIVANDKYLEATPSGYSNRTSNYSGTSHGGSGGISFGAKGHGRVHFGSNSGGHSGISSSHSESYRYKEVSVKTFEISCKCNDCGAVWKETVSEDDYPEIKKIPTMK